LKVREGPEEPVQPLTPPALADQLSFNATQLSKVRHELRTPINQILGYSELLEEQAEDEGQQGYIPDLRKIQAAGRRLLGMLDEHLAPPSKQSLAQAKAADAVAEGTGRDSGVKWKALAESAMAMAQTQHAQQGHGPGVPSATATPAPLDPVEVVASAAASAASKEILKGADDGDGHPGQASGKLLVVDDNELNRDMLSRRLQQRGYAVKTAEDGEKALARIEEEKFDTVLLDVMMPGISGLEVLEILRKTYTVAALPVIMATARDDSQDIVEALKLGANDYVTKPLDFPVVLARLETQLALKRATEQLEKRNQFIRNTFGRYLSDDVVASLLESESGLALGGENRNLTILMSDLRGFTSAAERLAPEQVVRVLNTYLAAMTDVIQQHKGTIDEFIGDAILAIFGAPQSHEDDAERAVACALAMQLAMEDVNRKIAEDGFPPVEMGIALNTGNVVVGNIGSQTRAKYGVVGSHVNLAARIESYSVGGQVLISEMTLLQAGAGVTVGKKIIINAKGFKDPIPIYDVRAISGKYNFTLPDAGEPLVELSHPIPVRFTMIIEKHVGEEVQQARILRMSEKEAELECDAEVPEMTNLKIRVVGASGEEIPADLYGKVMGTLDGVKGFLLRFTAMPPEVDRFFKSVLKAEG
ncbi:MAG: response regulator, partial [Acidobacteria bacterium]|nr:response regulator [Acidobacteriota bacterium]